MAMNRSTVGPRSYIVPKDVHLPSTEGMPELAWAIETATTPVEIDHTNRAAMAEYAARSSEWWDLGKQMAQQSADETEAAARERKANRQQAQEALKLKRLQKKTLKQKAAAEVERLAAQALKKKVQRANRKAKSPEKATEQWQRWTKNKAWKRTRSKVTTRLMGKQRV
jgi:hypothetical protein